MLILLLLPQNILTMKKNFYIAALLCSTMKVAAQDIHIIPQPVERQQQAGMFTLTADKTIDTNTNSVENQRITKLFAEKVATATGFKLPASVNKSANKSDINFNINTTPNPTIGNEGYTLEVTPKKVILSANTEGGFFTAFRLCANCCQKRLKINQLQRQSGRFPASKS